MKIEDFDPAALLEQLECSQVRSRLRSEHYPIETIEVLLFAAARRLYLDEFVDEIINPQYFCSVVVGLFDAERQEWCWEVDDFARKYIDPLRQELPRHYETQQRQRLRSASAQAVTVLAAE